MLSRTCFTRLKRSSVGWQPPLLSSISPLLSFSRSVVSDSLQPHELQYTRLPCPPSPRVYSDSHPLSWWCHPTISSSVTSFSSCPQSFPASHQGLFQWVNSSHQVAKDLELQLQHQSFQWTFRVDFLLDWLVWSPCQGTLKSLLLHHDCVSFWWTLVRAQHVPGLLRVYQ